MVRNILKIESLVILLGCLYFYQQISGNWALFLLFLLVPDISMIGYLKSKRLGAITYNLVHNYILAFLILVVGFYLHNINYQAFGLILMAHISIDRIMG